MNTNNNLEDMADVEAVHQQEEISLEDQKIHLEAMKIEANEYLALVKEDKNNYYKKEDEIGYILHADWFWEWENMVYLTDF